MMQRKNLFLMCGTPGSGKSTWVRKQIEESNVKSVHISRDEIRFAMVDEDEDYFARETEVFNAFCSKIQEVLEEEEAANIYVDATHLNEKARNKVLDRLDLRNADLYAVDFNMPLDVCIKQNALRSGRAFVPVSQVRRMWYSYDAPTENEKYKFTVLHAVAQKEKEDN